MCKNASPEPHTEFNLTAFSDIRFGPGSPKVSHFHLNRIQADGCRFNHHRRQFFTHEKRYERGISLLEALNRFMNDTGVSMKFNKSQIQSLSPNSFLLFRHFTWRMIGQPISDRHFPYLSTLSRNSGNWFGLSMSKMQATGWSEMRKPHFRRKWIVVGKEPLP